MLYLRADDVALHWQVHLIGHQHAAQRLVLVAPAAGAMRFIFEI